MPDAKRRNQRDRQDIYIGMFLAWLMMIAMMLIIVGPREILRASRAFRWQTHRCVVKSTTLDEKDGHAPALLVTVAYKFDGRSYEVTHRTSGRARKDLQDWANLFLRPDDNVDCRINPNNPRQLLLDREYVAFEFFLLAAVSMAILLAVLGLVLARCARKRPDSAESRLSFLLRKIGTMLLCGFVLVFCGTATIRGFGDVLLMFRSLGWHEAKATVQASSVTKVRQGRSWTYQLDLRYAYEFGGTQYESSQWNLFEDDNSKRKVLDKLHAGDVVTCYVNPANPVQAVLSRRHWLLLMLPVLLAIVAIAGHGFWSALRKKRSHSGSLGSRPLTQ